MRARNNPSAVNVQVNSVTSIAQGTALGAAQAMKRCRARLLQEKFTVMVVKFTWADQGLVGDFDFIQFALKVGFPIF